MNPAFSSRSDGLLAVFVSLTLAHSSQAGWLWQHDPDFTGTSGCTVLSPQFASIDNMNIVDLQGWDQAAQTFDFCYDTGGGSEPVEFSWAGSGANSAFLCVELDPDGNGVLPSSLTLDYGFSRGITVRAAPGGTVGGGFGALINPGDMGMDIATSYFNGYEDPAPIANQPLIQYIGGTPDSFTGTNTANWAVPVGGGTGFYGLRGTNPTATYYPYVATTPLRTEVLGRETIYLSNLTAGLDPLAEDTKFRISFDGGVPEFSPNIPEPSRAMLLALGGALLVLRRRRA